MGNTAAAGRTPKSGAWDAEEIFKLLPYFFLFFYLWVGQTYPEAKGQADTKQRRK